MIEELYSDLFVSIWLLINHIQLTNYLNPNPISRIDHSKVSDKGRDKHEIISKWWLRPFIYLFKFSPSTININYTKHNKQISTTPRTNKPILIINDY